MRKLFSLLALCLCCAYALADKQVSGVVVDEQGEPVIGASIQVLGTTLGTITDIDGVFELTIPDDANQIKVTSIGMQEQILEPKRSMRIVMKEHTEVIQEVVVTGYGNVTKGSYTGSAQAVDAETIDKKAPTEITKALAGEIAGVQVFNTSGQPGTNASVYIRGYGSINGSSAPLYIVDGVTYDGDISSIDPSDIASTTVLKDATATSLYGARGANGVIVINTKKGTTGEEGHIDVDVKYGANMRLLPLYDVITSPEEYVTLSWQSLYNFYRVVQNMPEGQAIKTANSTLYSNAGLPEDYNLWDIPGKNLINPYDASGLVNPTFAYADANRRKGYENLESWKDHIFRVGQKLDASVKFRGGTEKVKYYTSVGYLKDEGYYISSNYDRISLRSNVDFEPKKWLKGNVNVAYAYTHLNNPGQRGDGAMNNGFYYVNAIPAIYPVFMRDAEGNIAIDPRTGGPMYDYGNETKRSFGMGINPAGALQLDKANQTQHEVDAKGSLDFKLYKGLKLQINAGLHYYNNLASDLTNKYYGDAAGVGRIDQESINLFTVSAQELLTYNNTFGDHTVDIMVGHENYIYRSNYVYGYKSYLADGESVELGNAIKMDDVTGNTTRFAMESALAMASYTYDNRYVISGTYRADGSSRYARGHRWGHFGSVGAAWNFTSESFMENAKEWLRDGKLRLSWGVLGNQVNTLYAYTDMYTIENMNDKKAYVWASKGNQDITWERTSSVDLGLEFSIGKYMDAELDYFYKVTDNMLFGRAVAPSLGYSSIPTNDAKMLNQGVEFTFKVHAVDTRNIKLNINLNGAHYTNKMLQMPVDYYEADGTPVRMVMSGAMSEGHSMFDHYTIRYKGVNPDNGNALFEAYYDPSKGDLGADLGNSEYNYIPSLYQWQHDNPDKDPEKDLAKVDTEDYTMATSQYIGKSYLPDLDGGLGINLEVYGVTLDISTSYRIGGYGYDNTYSALMQNGNIGGHNWHVDIRNAWTENNRNTNVPRLSNGRDTNDSYATGGDRMLTSNSYFSLNSVQLGYNFPKKLIEKIKMQRLNIYVSGNNLAIATARRGYNPMTSFTGSSDTHGYSPLSTIMGGIKLTF